MTRIRSPCLLKEETLSHQNILFSFLFSISSKIYFFFQWDSILLLSYKCY